MTVAIINPKAQKTQEEVSKSDRKFYKRRAFQSGLIFGSFCVLFLYLSTCYIAERKNRYDRNDGHVSNPRMPEQIHLSLGSNSNELYVTWMTQDGVNKSTLKYSMINEDGTDGPEYVVPGLRSDNVIKDVNYAMHPYSKNRRRVLHTYRAKMSNLKPGSLYKYWIVSEDSMRVFCSSGEESVLFRSMTYKREIRIRDIPDPRREVNLAFYGDLGLINAQSVKRLTEDVSNGTYDLIIHNGDFAYDMDTKMGRYGDKFMQLIEPIASFVPYQTSVGNHEVRENFTHYNSRFTMVNSGGVNVGDMNNFYYSFNAGPIHFVAFSTEFYYFLDYSGMTALHNQYEWLIKDLTYASSPEQRSVRPWIIVFGHRPMYCSSFDKDDCTKETNILRKGFRGAYALEKLFYKFGVDVELYSHEHQYERFLPLYDGQVYNGTDDYSNPYHNPLAPVHLISGSAGCEEKLDPFVGKAAIGSVKRIVDYGYTRIKATQCELTFNQVSDDKDGTIVDEFTVSKTRQNFPTKSDGSERTECGY